MNNDKATEKLSDRGKLNVTRRVREAVGETVKEITREVEGHGFKKADFKEAIKKGLDEAKGDL